LPGLNLKARGAEMLHGLFLFILISIFKYHFVSKELL